MKANTEAQLEVLNDPDRLFRDEGRSRYDHNRCHGW
jgi:hypothetical protein